MPMPSEWLERLSASMADLAQKATEAETRVAESRDMSQQQLQAKAAEAKALAQQQREKASARATEKKNEVAAGWAALTVQLNQQRDSLHDKIGQKRDEHVKLVQRRADFAEDYAVASVDFAAAAILEAEAAILDAADAQATAEAKAPAQRTS